MKLVAFLLIIDAGMSVNSTHDVCAESKLGINYISVLGYTLDMNLEENFYKLAGLLFCSA